MLPDKDCPITIVETLTEGMSPNNLWLAGSNYYFINKNIVIFYDISAFSLFSPDQYKVNVSHCHQVT